MHRLSAVILMMAMYACGLDLPSVSSRVEPIQTDADPDPGITLSQSASTSIPTAVSSSASQFQPFGEVTVTIDFEVNGAGDNIDTIAFWEAPTPNDSLMFVTSKDIDLVEVWRYPFDSSNDQLRPLEHRCVNRGTNGVVVDQEEDILYVSIRRSRNVCVFSLPDLQHIDTFSSGVTYATEPNLALLGLTNGQKQLYVSDTNIVYIHDAASGRKLGQFIPTHASVEALVGDSYNQILFIPDEHGNSGIYPHTPDGSPYTREGKSRFGENVFSDDAEGILIYTCPADGRSDNGEGLIVASDQVTNQSTGNDYEVFDRQSWASLGRIKLEDTQGRFVYNTDGIASTQQSSADYPLGLFAAINNDTSTVGVGWDKILAATGLSCD